MYIVYGLCKLTITITRNRKLTFQRVLIVLSIYVCASYIMQNLGFYRLFTYQILAYVSSPRVLADIWFSPIILWLIDHEKMKRKFNNNSFNNQLTRIHRIILTNIIYGKTRTSKIFEKNLNCSGTEIHDIILLLFVQFLREIYIYYIGKNIKTR